MATAVQNQFSLNPDELADLARFEKERGSAIAERDAAIAKFNAAERDLEAARAEHRKAAVALALGDRNADVEVTAASVRRLEALVAGLAHLRDAATEAHRDVESRVAPLHTKRLALENLATRTRLEAAIGTAEERLDAAKSGVRQAQDEHRKAIADLSNFMDSLRPAMYNSLL